MRPKGYPVGAARREPGKSHEISLEQSRSRTGLVERVQILQSGERRIATARSEEP